MEYYSHIAAFDGISFFKAPPGGTRRLGYVTPPGEEKIEIILVGYARYHFPRDTPLSPGVSQRSVRVGPGAVLWHTEGCLTLRDPDPVEPYRCMCFRYHVSHPRSFSAPLHSQWEDLSECSAFCWEAFSRYHRGTCDPQKLGFSVYGRLLWETLKEGDRHTQRSVPKAVSAMVQAVREAPQLDWSVRALGRVADISESHVFLLFRQHLNTSPHDFVLAQRLNKAKELLITSSERVKEVCFECGFSDAAHFTRVFRHRLGVTPTVYREKYATP